MHGRNRFGPTRPVRWGPLPAVFRHPETGISGNRLRRQDFISKIKLKKGGRQTKIENGSVPTHLKQLTN
jgi:hypothetical protein